MATGSLNFDPSRGTRRYDWATSLFGDQAGVTATRLGPIDAHEVAISGDQPIYFRVGDVTVEAEDIGGFYLPAGLPFHLQITSGEYISVIRAGATDANVAILIVVTD